MQCMRLWIGVELSYFHSQVIMMYFRAFEARHTVASYPFMPKLPLTKTTLVIKFVKMAPETTDFVFVRT